MQIPSQVWLPLYKTLPRFDTLSSVSFPTRRSAAASPRLSDLLSAKSETRQLEQRSLAYAIPCATGIDNASLYFLYYFKKMHQRPNINSSCHPAKARGERRTRHTSLCFSMIKAHIKAFRRLLWTLPFNSLVFWHIQTYSPPTAGSWSWKTMLMNI